MVIESNSPEETFRVGKELGERAYAGQVFTLTGDLGVGKTVFTQGLAKGLGIDEPVNSPTFTIVQEYDGGRLPFYHFDVYRIGDIEEMEEVGFDVDQVEKWDGPYIKPNVPKDPWGNDYVYVFPGEHGDFDLSSYGGDGQPGGEGENADINNWE